jgi:hypothetical protein
MRDNGFHGTFWFEVVHGYRPLLHNIDGHWALSRNCVPPLILCLMILFFARDAKESSPYTITPSHHQSSILNSASGTRITYYPPTRAIYVLFVPSTNKSTIPETNPQEIDAFLILILHCCKVNKSRFSAYTHDNCTYSHSIILKMEERREQEVSTRAYLFLFTFFIPA